MTEEEKFAQHLAQDQTFWGDLFRSRKVKTFKDALAVAGGFRSPAKPDHASEATMPKPVDYMGITRSAAAQ